MYQERLLDFVQFATDAVNDAPDSFSLENCLCSYFKENSRKVNEDGSKTYRGTSLRSWLSVFAKFWLFCKATPDLKRSLPSIENMIRKLELTETSVKRARTFEKDDLLKYYGLEHTLENLVDKAFAVIAISFAARGCEVTFLDCDDLKLTIDRATSERIYSVTFKRSKTSGVTVLVTTYISGQQEVRILDAYEKCFTRETRKGIYFRVLEYRSNGVTMKVTGKVLRKNNTAATPKKMAIALHSEDPKLYTSHAFRRTSATLCAPPSQPLGCPIPIAPIKPKIVYRTETLYIASRTKQR
jgi:hypothetical protein